jgi:hypothetical protein
MSIPQLDPITGNLPPGVHDATWDELLAVFASNSHRARLADGLRRALEDLRAAGCARVYVDGSFVTAKEFPDDFDACWELADVDPDLLHPALLDFAHERAAQKARYAGELFLADSPADPAGTTFIEFFQTDRDGQPKGVLALDPQELQ